MISVAVVGASGYVGGELMRLLMLHPEVSSLQATSDTLRGKPISSAHTNLRGATDLKFIGREEVVFCDVLFLAMPHGSSSVNVAAWNSIAKVIIDLSADFRLKDMHAYNSYYKTPHAAPELLPSFVSGIPEYFRDQLRTANRIAGPGCTALAAILAIKPLRLADVIESSVFVDSKVGSSGSGARARSATHHPLRAGGIRVFKATGHRHEAEISAFCDVNAYVTVSSIDAVRGILVAAYCVLQRNLTDNNLRDVYRSAYASEPFTRLVKRRGEDAFSLPEPKLLSGTNYCDVGFSQTRDGRCVVAFAALDNLTKGAAGNAVHCMNIRFGFDETFGLKHFSLHPV